MKGSTGQLSACMRSEGGVEARGTVLREHPGGGRREYKRYPVIPDPAIRRKKGLQVSSILRDALQGRAVKHVLDVGCSSGVLLDTVAATLEAKRAVGVDMDGSVLPKATPRRVAVLADAMILPVADDCIDVVICHHTYQYTPDPWKLLDEIKRVLRPGGIVYFGAVNARWPIESHYRLPFVHWLPRSASGAYLRLFGHRSEYFEKPLSTPRLRDLVSGFEVRDYTLEVIRQPEKYRATDIMHPSLGRLAVPLARLFYSFLPGYVWVLVKR